MKRNDSKAIARLKRMYESFRGGLFVKENGKWRPCESITEFLSLKWVKKLKNTSSFERHPLNKLDAKMKNKRERYSERKQIKEGIEEYNNNEYYTCGSCELFNRCSVYKDDEICKDYRD